MVYLMLAVFAGVIFVIWAAICALAGRSAMPKSERLPLRQWRFADVRANFRIGCRELTLARDGGLSQRSIDRAFDRLPVLTPEEVAKRRRWRTDH